MVDQSWGAPACLLPMGYSFRLNSSLVLAFRGASYLTLKNTEAQKGQVAYPRLPGSWNPNLLPKYKLLVPGTDRQLLPPVSPPSSLGPS